MYVEQFGIFSWSRGTILSPAVPLKISVKIKDTIEWKPHKLSNIKTDERKSSGPEI
jgi:hypothetical protein